MTPTLPSEVWAHILHFNDFDEVSSIVCTSRFFLEKVTSKLKHLLIRSACRMDLKAEAIERYSGVENVYIYCLIKEALPPQMDMNNNSDVTVKVDGVAAAKVIPFLQKIPKLMFCHIGRVSDQGGDFYLDENMIKSYNLAYDRFDTNESASNMTRVISEACRAYNNFEFSPCLIFDGLLPVQLKGGCLWKNAPKLQNYRMNHACQICEMICYNYPPITTLMLEDEEVPCVCLEERIRWARWKLDDYHYANSLRLRLIEHLCRPKDMLVDHLSSPGQKVCGLWYEENQYLQMRILIGMGADMRNIIQEALLNVSCDQEDGVSAFFNCRRVIISGAYNRLQDIGFHLRKDDFYIADLD